MSGSRTWIVLLIALVVGGAAAYVVKLYIDRQMSDMQARGKTETVQVVVAKQDLARGTKLSQENVAVRAVPKEWAHSNAVVPDQFARAENQTLAVAATRGEPILWAQLEGEKLPTFSARILGGRRAITVPVDEISSISGMLAPGDAIDVVATVRQRERTVLLPLLQNMTVMATGTQVQNTADGAGRRSFNTVTLDVTPEEANRVLAAREVGKLTALLRAPGDKARVTGGSRDALALLGLDSAYADPRLGSVPVIYGGARLRDAPRLAAFREQVPREQVPRQQGEPADPRAPQQLPSDQAPFFVTSPMRAQ